MATNSPLEPGIYRQNIISSIFFFFCLCHSNWTYLRNLLSDLIQTKSKLKLKLHIGSFHAKWTTGCQVTPSDFAHINTVCSSIGRMNTQKKSVANSLRFWKYSSSKIWPDPPLFGCHASHHWFIWSLTCIYSSLQQDTKVKIATCGNFQPYFKNLKSKTLYLA